MSRVQVFDLSEREIQELWGQTPETTKRSVKRSDRGPPRPYDLDLPRGPLAKMGEGKEGDHVLVAPILDETERVDPILEARMRRAGLLQARELARRARGQPTGLDETGVVGEASFMLDCVDPSYQAHAPHAPHAPRAPRSPRSSAPSHNLDAYQPVRFGAFDSAYPTATRKLLNPGWETILKSGYRGIHPDVSTGIQQEWLARNQDARRKPIPLSARDNLGHMLMRMRGPTRRDPNTRPLGPRVSEYPRSQQGFHMQGPDAWAAVESEFEFGEISRG